MSGPIIKMVIYICRLAEQGHEVIGSECSAKGVKEFFETNKLSYTTDKIPGVDGQVFKVSLSFILCI